jgi:hypothetical protein
MTIMQSSNSGPAWNIAVGEYFNQVRPFQPAKQAAFDAAQQLAAQQAAEAMGALRSKRGGK